MNPKPPSVLAPKGSKDVYNIVGNNEKENITVLITGNAAGDLAPPFILFAGKHLPKRAAQMAPKEFAFGCSENGWMTGKNFYEFIVNVFEPWFTKKTIERPVILYSDGHKSHLTLHLSKFCSEHQIVLIALHPNATHILQPLDVSFFRTFKAKWQKTNRKICEDFSSVGIQKYQFAPMLKKTLDTLDHKKLLESGFVKCGLHPFNVNAIDFTKVLNLNKNTSVSEELVENLNNKKDERLKIFESFITDEKLQTFRTNESAEWKGETKDESLFQIWYKLFTLGSEITDKINNQVKVTESRGGNMDLLVTEFQEIVEDNQVNIYVICKLELLIIFLLYFIYTL